MRTGLTRRRRADRGATLIMVSVFLIVAVIMMAAVVDLGGQRQERKEVTLSTDAAALAAASLADTEDPDLLAVSAGTLVDCDQVGISPHAANPESFGTVRAAVDDYLSRNGGSSYVDCKVVRTSFREGYVVVSADEIVEYAFAPAIGINEGDVAGASVAAIEVNSGGGLRPVGICALTTTMAGVSGYPEITLNDLYNTTSAGYDLDADGYVVPVGDTTRTTVTARFAIDKVKGGECTGASGGGSGNFGKLDFGGSTSTSCTEIGHFCKDYADGYYGTLTNPTKGDTGNNWGNNANEDSTLNLEQNVGQFWAPVFLGLAGNGGNADFSLLYFVQMEMVNHCFGAHACKFDGATWFDFRVSRMLPFAEAGPPLTDDANQKRPRLCAVENDAAAIAAGCPQIVAGPTSTVAPSSSTTTTSSTTSTSSTTVAPLCQITRVTANRTSVATNGSGKLKDDLTLTIEVVNGSHCAGIQSALQKGVVINLSQMSGSGNVFVGTESENADKFDPGTYDWVVRHNGGPLNYGGPISVVVS
ncbi:pilus assembly protein TadG-related protein [Actinospongicola halichondriae]|uniref:pilus assembly protein TadG-related protein n=1 Tax=Actinospongicola halichondriae TaxID=3236844 RepID=UPI003D428146